MRISRVAFIVSLLCGTLPAAGQSRDQAPHVVKQLNLDGSALLGSDFCRTADDRTECAFLRSRVNERLSNGADITIRAGSAVTRDGADR
jgi:hypothetical protein